MEVLFLFIVAKSCLTLLQPHGLQPARLLWPSDFLGKNSGVGCHFLLQGIFPTRALNCLSHQGSLGRRQSSISLSLYLESGHTAVFTCANSLRITLVDCEFSYIFLLKTFILNRDIYTLFQTLISGLLFQRCLWSSKLKLNAQRPQKHSTQCLEWRPTPYKF